MAGHLARGIAPANDLKYCPSHGPRKSTVFAAARLPIGSRVDNLNGKDASIRSLLYRERFAENIEMLGGLTGKFDEQ